MFHNCPSLGLLYYSLESLPSLHISEGREFYVGNVFQKAVKKNYKMFILTLF